MGGQRTTFFSGFILSFTMGCGDHTQAISVQMYVDRLSPLSSPVVGGSKQMSRDYVCSLNSKNV